MLLHKGFSPLPPTVVVFQLMSLSKHAKNTEIKDIAFRCNGAYCCRV